jgi:hypothetical protein
LDKGRNQGGKSNFNAPQTVSNPVHPALGCTAAVELSALHTLYPAHRQSDRNNESTLESAATLKYCPPQQEFMILAEPRYEISYPPINSYCVYLTRCTSAAAKSNKINYYVFVRLQTLVAHEGSPASGRSHAFTCRSANQIQCAVYQTAAQTTRMKLRNTLHSEFYVLLTVSLKPANQMPSIQSDKYQCRIE